MHSLPFLLKGTLGSLLGSEDLTQSIARAEGVNSSMIEMLGALGRENDRGKLSDFAKKELTDKV